MACYKEHRFLAAHKKDTNSKDTLAYPAMAILLAHLLERPESGKTQTADTLAVVDTTADIAADTVADSAAVAAEFAAYFVADTAACTTAEFAADMAVDLATGTAADSDVNPGVGDVVEAASEQDAE